MNRILVANIVTIPTPSVSDLGRYVAVKLVGWSSNTDVPPGKHRFFQTNGREVVGVAVNMTEEIEAGHFPKVVGDYTVIDTNPVAEEKRYRMRSGGNVRFSAPAKPPTKDV